MDFVYNTAQHSTVGSNGRTINTRREKGQWIISIPNLIIENAGSERGVEDEIQMKKRVNSQAKQKKEK